jgi:hypothetical protein
MPSMTIPPSIFASPRPKRKVFVSFHHKDQSYRDEFDRLFGDHFISVSVDPGDIDPDNDTEYIKRLIQEENIVQSSVVFALYGAETHTRKHVDWEISAALSDKVGGHKGLVIMLLPTFPQPPFNVFGVYDKRVIYPHLHPRTAANLESGYADLFFWPGLYTTYQGVTVFQMPQIAETAAQKRQTHNRLIDNSAPQYKNNR